MPKAKVEREISNDGVTRVVEVDVTERDVTKVAKYSVPANAQAYMDIALGASDKPGSAKTLLDYAFGQELDDNGKDEHDTQESAQAFLWRAFCDFVDKKARQSVYVSLAQESTKITTPDGPVDIMEFPIDRLVRGINGYRAAVTARMLPLEMTADKMPVAERAGFLDNAKKEAEKAVKYGPWRAAARQLVEDGKASENSGSGMLEIKA